MEHGHTPIPREVDGRGRSRLFHPFVLAGMVLALLTTVGQYRPDLRRVWRVGRVATGSLRDSVRRLGDPLRIQRTALLAPEDHTGKRRREHVLVDLINERWPTGPVRVAEIGCDRGGTSAHLLKYCPQIEEIVAIDLRDPRSSRLRSERRFRFLQGYSDGCAARFEPESFDLVFIDADHSEEWVRRDIAAWFPRVKPGGIISGHDYGSRNHPGVKVAVDQFFAHHSRPVRTDANKVWWTAKA